MEFPQRVKGTRDFILVDEEIQVREVCRPRSFTHILVCLQFVGCSVYSACR